MGLLEDIYSESIAIASAEAEDEHEQYFTHPEISSLMASMFDFSGKKTVRILDAGSGTGILGYCAVMRAFESGVSKIHLVCIETEKRSLKLLKKNLKDLEKMKSNFSFEILKTDFLTLSNVGKFDFIISNPPYSKIRSEIESGGTSPNWYSRFMEVSINLLSKNGQMVYIIPRSFTNGVYFKKFRQNIFTDLSTTKIHLFNSRKNIFEQKVLQEIMIICLEKNTKSTDVLVTSSLNRKDLYDLRPLKISRDIIQLGAENAYRLVIPTTESDIEILNRFRGWKGRFKDHGIEISTGRVVAFRSTEFLSESEEKGNTYPMVWPTHVSLSNIEWPKNKCKKEQYIDHTATDRIIPNQNYVIMKRFTTKEEAKRLVTCPLKKGELPGKFIGLENHLNYIHGGEKEMQFTLCKGISYLLNTTLFDDYIRIINGQTQVNAADIVNLPIPDIEIIKQLGKCKSKNNDYSKSLQRLLTKASQKN
jgi:adenine-specific DNA-methyltransferase